MSLPLFWHPTVEMSVGKRLRVLRVSVPMYTESMQPIYSIFGDPDFVTTYPAGGHTWQTFHYRMSDVQKGERLQ